MSANKKLNVDAMEASSNDSSSDDDSTPEAYSGNELVNIDFEGRAPVDPHCDGISQLLSRLFLKADINCMQLAELIISQNYVGSVIAQCEPDEPESDEDDDMCEDDTIFGITTVVNLICKKVIPCVEQLRSFILTRAKNHATDDVYNYFHSILNNNTQHVGFLINERFINIPAEISVPLLENLLKEIEEAKKKGMPFNFENFLMIVKLYKNEKENKGKIEEVYTNDEEEFFFEAATSSFEFSVQNECDDGLAGDWSKKDPSLTPYRKVLLFDSKQLPKLIQTFKNLLQNK